MIIDLSETEKANFRQEFIKRLKRIMRETQIHCFPGNTAIGHELYVIEAEAKGLIEIALGNTGDPEIDTEITLEKIAGWEERANYVFEQCLEGNDRRAWRNYLHYLINNAGWLIRCEVTGRPWGRT